MIVNSHVIISGGGTGVGAATAHVFDKAGAKVTILGRTEESLQAQGLSYQVCDVTNLSAVKAAFEAARAEHGPISTVVANAGASDSVPFAKMTTESLSNMLDVNIVGVFNCLQAALPDMKVAGRGQMIVIASTAGLKGYPYVAGYCAAKHGVVGLTRALSLELAPLGITVNAICPGFTETPMLDRSIENITMMTGMSNEDAVKSLKRGNPQKRFIQVDEIAGSAVWLCSESARSVNGHTLSLNGGEL